MYALLSEWVSSAADCASCWLGRSGDTPQKALFNLGVLYANGTRVGQDDAEVVCWHRLVADRGHAKSQRSL